MLRQLSIRNFVVVDQTELEFSSGFTVLTGETGAGKSILIDALDLALGERGDSSVVRQGAERAEIEAEFDSSQLDEFNRWLAENDLEGEEGSCLLRRVIDNSGRSRAYVNGRQVTLQQLRAAGEWLVDIHGQHAHQSLLQEAKQRQLVDTLSGAQALAREVQGAYRLWMEAKKLRQALVADSARIEAERENLDWQIKELRQLAFDAGEWSELQDEEKRLRHAADLLEGAQFALSSLSESENDCLSLLHGAANRIDSLVSFDSQLQAIADLIEPARINLEEAAHALRRYCQRIDLDPARLAAVEARVDSIHSAARKYRLQPEELPAHFAALQARFSELEQAGNIAVLQQKEEAAHEKYRLLAEKLSVIRADTATKLSLEVTDAMQQLSMTGGRFEVALKALPEGAAHGLENVEFLVAGHAGAVLRSLSKVASGGEMSRISLAIQVYSSRASQVPTLIFDEVDVGIGGGVAEIVGRLLQKLGNDRQVLCVTHLPQVASRAQAQWSVSKKGGASVAARLSADERVREIARMLGGVEITETTLRHAAEMLGI